MRNCLIAASMLGLALVAECAPANGDSNEPHAMSETVINGIRVSLAGPESLPLAVVLRGSPRYDGPRLFFTVSLKNESGDTKTLPFDELRRNSIVVYRNPATGAESADNRTPPPKRDGSVEAIPPGAAKTFQVVFEYPASIATMDGGVAVTEFCVKWESQWLRASSYVRGAYDWNESYEVCRLVRIVDE